MVEICEELDYTELYKTYVRMWRKVNPVTLFEILVFAFMNRLFSSREIERACKTDIRFMWLLDGEPAPSDSTISRFMRGHLAEVLEDLFYQFVAKLCEMGEGVFGVLKEDYGFRRFLTRGKRNIETQFFLLAFAFNIEKLCNRTKKGRIGLDLFPLNVS